MKNTTKSSIVIFAFMLFSYPVNGQSISGVGTGKIVELESIQSEVTGTFIVATMERDMYNSTKVLIHRSTNYANTWSFIDSISPVDGNTEIPDPVVSADASGNFYLALMRVNNNLPSELTVDIEVYKSLDDGQTWTLSGIPHYSDSIADYPQIIARNNGELYLVYSYISGFPLVNNSTLTFRKSADGGNSWSSDFYIGAGTVKSIGPDISLGYNNKLLISAGHMDSSYIYNYSSDDNGNTWDTLSQFSISNNEKGHITKPVANPLFDFYGIISHKPHLENTAIFYHSSINGNPFSQILDTGSYAQGCITDDGIIHVVYNKKENSSFKILYRNSNDIGLTFTNPIPIYSQNYSNSAFGEYQSLVCGNDGLFYLTFCDWSDNSRAKTLVFNPSMPLSINDAGETLNHLTVYPNPVSDVFSIRLPDNIQLSRVKIVDLTGQEKEQWIIKKDTQIINCDISHLNNGLYLVVSENENKIFVNKIIKRQ